MNPKRLDITTELANIRDIYKQNSRSRAFNALVYGDFGTGKTFSLKTCRRPILIHSFDPGGTQSLLTEIEEGWIVVDNRYEEEDGNRPTAYRAWEREFQRLRRINIFEQIGTYVIDSLTTWSEALMNATVQANTKNNLGEPPQLRDYQIQMLTIRDTIKVCCGLPCDFILTGHVDMDKDEISGRMVTHPMVTGKLKQKLPLLFDEVWCTEAKAGPNGTTYSFITNSTGYYKARSRLAAGGKLQIRESQDYKKILKKVGRDASDITTL